MNYQSKYLKSLLAVYILLLFSWIIFAPEPSFAQSLFGTGRLEGYVMDGANSNPLKDAVITVMEKTVKSNSSGHFTISGLLPGRVIVDAKLKDYDDFLTTITIEKGDNSYNIKLKPAPKKLSKNIPGTPKTKITAAAPAATAQISNTPLLPYKLKVKVAVSGIVLDSITNTPISRARVLIDGNTYFTDINGEFTSRPVENSQIFVRGEAPNHTAYESNVQLAKGNNKLKILLVPEEPNLISQGGINKNSIVEYTRFSQSYAKVFGYIKNSKTRQPISEATVVIGTQTAKTNKEGYYSLEGLSLGFMDISVLSNKYGVYKGKININAVSNKYDVSLTDEEKHSTLIGTVNEKETGQPIYGAKIQVADKIVITDKFGSFTISDLPYDYYNLIVEQNGYQRIERAISVNEEKVNVNVSLADDYAAIKSQKN